MLPHFRFVSPFLLTVALPIGAASAKPVDWAAYVPSGWTLIGKTAEGKSAVLMIEQNDPTKRIKNDGLGAEVLNTNPRQLIFLSLDGARYRKTGSAENFLPPENSADSPCLLDPIEGRDLTLKKGVLTIRMQYFLSCGSYDVTNKTYKFRAEQGNYRLIGYDNSSFSRASLEGQSSSTNYLTNRRKRITGERMDKDRGSPSEKTAWTKIPHEVFFLDAMNQTACDDYESAPSWCGE